MTTFLTAVKEVWTEVLPKGAKEYSLIGGLWIVYFMLGREFALNSHIIDHPTIPYDIYFGFDNPSIYKEGIQNVTGHPFMKFFMSPFIFIGDLIAEWGGYKSKTIVAVFLCAGFMAWSAVFIYRYLLQIIQLEQRTTYLLTLLYAIFSTNLTLCFTPESFTLTAFFLPFAVYYFSLFLQQKKEVPFISYLTFTFLLGGITITNAAKALLPVYTEVISWKKRVLKVVPAALLFGVALLIPILQHNIINDATYRVAIFTDRSSDFYLLIPKIISNFFGSPLLFPAFETQTDDVFHNPILIIAQYDQVWQYLLVLTLLFLGIWVLIRQFNNPFVQLLALLFSVDIALHVFIRYGLHEAFIYGAHWVYLVPLFLGWLYQDLKNYLNKTILDSALLLILLTVFMNNAYRLTELYQFALTYYHV